MVKYYLTPNLETTGIRGVFNMTRKSATKNRAAKPFPSPKVAPIVVDAWLSQQGVQPVENVGKLLDEISDAWPEGEDVDQFLDDIYRSCRGRPYRRKR